MKQSQCCRKTKLSLLCYLHQLHVCSLANSGIEFGQRRLGGKGACGSDGVNEIEEASLLTFSLPISSPSPPPPPPMLAILHPQIPPVNPIIVKQRSLYRGEWHACTNFSKLFYYCAIRSIDQSINQSNVFINIS